MKQNTWGFQIVTINEKDNCFDTLLSLNIGDEQKTRKIFAEMSNEYGVSNGDTGFLIDLLDDSDSIIEDIAVTKEGAKEIAAQLGHKLSC